MLKTRHIMSAFRTLAILLPLAVIAAGGAAAPAQSAELKRVDVATLHWPPFAAADLPREGAVSALVKKAFEGMGYRANVRFWPWNRAIAKANVGDDGIVGYFPGYHCRHDPDSDFIASKPLGATPLGLARHVDATHSWSTLEDLKRYRIGTVVGYAITDEFEALIASGSVQIITSSDDATNLMKLINRQIDYAVIDEFVMNYLMYTDETIHENRHLIEFDDNILEMKDMFLCFRNTPEKREMKNAFNRQLESMKPQERLDEYIHQLVSHLTEQN